LDNEDGTKSHCCLGVAQWIAFRNGFEPQPGSTPEDYDWGPAGLNLSIGQWYGFDIRSDSDPLLVLEEGDNTIEVTCVVANDIRRWSFAQIADALQARYITPEPSTESHTHG
jgi:hypothetical protein